MNADAFFFTLFVAALALFIFSLFITETPKVGCDGFGKYDANVEYVVGLSKDYTATGGTSTDPKVANAYNYGILYDVCR